MMADEQVTNVTEETKPEEATPEVTSTEATAPVEETSPVVETEAPVAVAENVETVSASTPAPVVPEPKKSEVMKAEAPQGLPGTVTVAPEGGDIIDFGKKRDDPRNRRRTRVGRVISSKMEKTIIVSCETRVRHPLYGKFMKRTTKFKAHDETNQCGEGDTVEIMETRPISKDKNWRLVKIVEKAK